MRGSDRGCAQVDGQARVAAWGRQTSDHEAPRQWGEDRLPESGREVEGMASSASEPCRNELMLIRRLPQLSGTMTQCHSPQPAERRAPPQGCAGALTAKLARNVGHVKQGMLWHVTVELLALQWTVSAVWHALHAPRARDPDTYRSTRHTPIMYSGPLPKRALRVNFSDLGR
jgi:hypothetical protein